MTTDGQKLAEMGTDSRKWAAEFKRVVSGEPSEETLQAWFGNAMAQAITIAGSQLRSSLLRACDLACYLECPCSTKERLSGHRTDCIWGEYREEVRQLRTIANNSPFVLTESFEEAWARMEKLGFLYGHEALEQVRLGFDLARYGEYVAQMDAEPPAKIVQGIAEGPTTDEELERGERGITNGPTLLRMVTEIRSLRKLAIKLEVERDEALDLSSCNTCKAGVCSAHQPFTGQIAALKEALEDAKHTLLNIKRSGGDGSDYSGYALKMKQADNCLGRIEEILNRDKK